MSVKITTRKGPVAPTAEAVGWTKPALERAGQSAVADMKQRLQTADPGGVALSLAPGRRAKHRPSLAHIATGATVNSIGYKVEMRDGIPVLRVWAGGAAKWLNWGRARNRRKGGGAAGPLAKAIEQWATVKGLPNRGPLDKQEFVDLVTFRVAGQGMAPTYFFTDSVAEMRKGLRNNVFGRRLNRKTVRK